jgi:ABC-type Na+ efflux pump permease subunit
VSVNPVGPRILDGMDTPAPRRNGMHQFAHSTGLRLLGFVWVFAAGMLIAAGSGLAILGIAGGLLVRIRPDTQRNINYDPSSIALLAPIPFLAGVFLMVLFAIRARRIGR